MDHLENYCWLAALFPVASGKPERHAAVGIPKPKQAKSVEDAESAKELRKDWNIGMDPIENMVETFEDHAAAVLAGAKVQGDDERKVVVTNASMSGDRQRFNLAHELAHLVIKSKTAKEDEDTAHRFAAAFLVPDEVAYKELGSAQRTQPLGLRVIMVRPLFPDPLNFPRARYFFFLGAGAAGFFAEVTPKGDAGTAAFFDCLGFLASRLLRFWPLAIEVLLIGHAVRHRLAAIQFSGWKWCFSSGQENRSKIIV